MTTPLRIGDMHPDLTVRYADGQGGELRIGECEPRVAGKLKLSIGSCSMVLDQTAAGALAQHLRKFQNCGDYYIGMKNELVHLYVKAGKVYAAAYETEHILKLTLRPKANVSSGTLFYTPKEWAKGLWRSLFTPDRHDEVELKGLRLLAVSNDPTGCRVAVYWIGDIQEVCLPNAVPDQLALYKLWTEKQEGWEAQSVLDTKRMLEFMNNERAFTMPCQVRHEDIRSALLPIARLYGYNGDQNGPYIPPA